MPRPRARSFRDLVVWQKAALLVDEIYDLCRRLPKEEFALGSQLKRAALSVQSNIAEGWGRATRPELH